MTARLPRQMPLPAALRHPTPGEWRAVALDAQRRLMLAQIALGEARAEARAMADELARVRR